ncbi:MAG: hypothetical protein HY040_22365 [Planctomycetes bacterium]|nr:hypothetical protein [Planctomycetota bacterium]
MRWLFSLTACVILLVPPLSARAGDSARDPVRLIPAQVELVAKLNRPRDLLETLTKHEAVKGLMKLEFLSGYFDGTNSRRFLQLVTYLEKQLGHDREDLLDRLAGRGAAFGLELNEGKPKVLLVLGARDEKTLAKFLDLTRGLIDQELERQEQHVKFTRGERSGCVFWHIGKEVFLAQLGADLVVTNKEKLLHDAIDIHKGNDSASISKLASFEASQKHRPDQSLVWLWLDLQRVRAIPSVKTVFDSLTPDPQILVLVGGLFDVVKRSDYVCASISQDGPSFHARIALPQGREGMSKAAVMFLPDDRNGSLPMLQPPRAISCTSYYLDLGKFWDHRREILNAKQADNLEGIEKKSAPFLGGVKIGTLLKQAGKYHRIVYAEQDKSPYKIKPATPIGAFALVLDMRDPAFAKSMNSILRGAALVGGIQFGLRLVEEKQGEHTLVTYYFPEDKRFDADVNNIRFNFCPCFTHVGDQFVISSTLELGRDLIDLLEKENRGDTSPATSRTHIYAKGVADNVRKAEGALLTQFVLSQGLSAKSARQQVRDLADLVERLGQLQFGLEYGANDFRFDIRWLMERK